jgi:hypothetical protein
MKMGPVVRSVSAVLVGMVFVTVSVEALELTLVTAISREVLTGDPEAYYAVRNGTVFLIVKVLYNTAGAMGGGYLAARLAGSKEVLHGIVLALIQTATLAWAASQPDFARWAPAWLWVALIVVTPLGILIGAWLAGKRGERQRASGGAQAGHPEAQRS